jgi:hypothetical protein
MMRNSLWIVPLLLLVHAPSASAQTSVTLPLATYQLGFEQGTVDQGILTPGGVYIISAWGNASPCNSAEPLQCEVGSFAGMAEAADVPPEVSTQGSAVFESGDVDPGEFITTTAEMEYYFSVVSLAGAPTCPPACFVPVDVGGYVDAHGTNAVNLFAYWYVDGVGSVIDMYGTAGESIAATDELDVPPEQSNEVLMSASCDVEVDSPGVASTCSSLADPTITIDPSFADAADYAIELSPNIASTPEPGTLTLMLTGIGFMIVTRKRLSQLFRLNAGTHHSLSLAARH